MNIHRFSYEGSDFTGEMAPLSYKAHQVLWCWASKGIAMSKRFEEEKNRGGGLPPHPKDCFSFHHPCREHFYGSLSMGFQFDCSCKNQIPGILKRRVKFRPGCQVYERIHASNNQRMSFPSQAWMRRHRAFPRNICTELPSRNFETFRAMFVSYILLISHGTKKAGQWKHQTEAVKQGWAMPVGETGGI